MIVIIIGIAVLLGVLTHVDSLTNNDSTRICGSQAEIAAEGKLQVTITQEVVPPRINCSFTVTGQKTSLCNEICYDMREFNASFHRDRDVYVNLTFGDYFQIFKDETAIKGPWCSENLSIPVNLNIDTVNITNERFPKYNFSLEFYTKCGNKRYITFEEAAKQLKGYHHGDEFYDKIYENKVHGIITGASLASIFLVVLVIYIVYYRFKRKRSPQNGTPPSQVSFKKKMKMMKSTLKKTTDEDCEIIIKY